MVDGDLSGIHGRFEASVNIFIDPSQKTQVVDALSKLKNTKEIYDVKSEFDIVSLVSAPSLEEFSDVLRKQIMKIKGVKSTITSIVLKTYKRPKPLQNNRRQIWSDTI